VTNVLPQVNVPTWKIALGEAIQFDHDPSLRMIGARKVVAMLEVPQITALVPPHRKPGFLFSLKLLQLLRRLRIKRIRVWAMCGYRNHAIGLDTAPLAQGSGSHRQDQDGDEEASQ
jgi:hypothetical protein